MTTLELAYEGRVIVFPIFRNSTSFSAISLDDIEKFSNPGFLCARSSTA